jgi:hypothetical protein
MDTNIITREPVAATANDPVDKHVDRLAAAISFQLGLSHESVLRHLMGLGATMSMTALHAVAREKFQPHELQVSVVRQRIRKRMNKATPRWTHCSAGVTSIEISPNGGYSRCPKFGVRQLYIGNLRDEGPLKMIDLDSEDIGCSIRCPQLMCFTKNVLRATSQEELDAQIADKGLRGNYCDTDKGATSKVFFRWKITDVCNYTCAYCTDWRSVNKQGIELTDDEILASLDKMIAQFSMISLRLTGGEPSARRCYVELMRRIHANLDRFSDIEIRTNFSYQPKHREVLSWDWQGKLHLHIGCHVRDKNFMPWRTVELLRNAPDADYCLKFVATISNREHVMWFRKYFIDNGIPSLRIRIIEEVNDQESAVTDEPPVVYGVPFARQYLEESARREAAKAAEATLAEPVAA